MGADYYETVGQKGRERGGGHPQRRHRPVLHHQAGDHRQGRPHRGQLQDRHRPAARPDVDTPSYSIRDGIVVIPKGTVLAPGTVI